MKVFAVSGTSVASGLFWLVSSPVSAYSVRAVDVVERRAHLVGPRSHLRECRRRAL